MGMPIENSAILDVADKLRASESIAEASEAEFSKEEAGDILQNDVVSYDYNGVTKYAATSRLISLRFLFWVALYLIGVLHT